ncbi:MAG: hypothetical protein KC469_06890 [Flavobacteriaceae bacterium]|nr:hypothetical protein [Flavobacteriaceae bacterium]
MNTRINIINSGVKILRAFDQPDTIVRDSLIKNIAIITSDPTFDPIQNDLISSGNLRLIRDEKLKRLLSNWSSDVVALKEIEVVWVALANHRLELVLTDLGLSRDAINSFMNDIDHTWILDDQTKLQKIEIGTSKLNAPLHEIVTSKCL